MLPNLFSSGGGHEGRDVGDAGDGVRPPEPLQEAARHQRQLERVIVPIWKEGDMQGDTSAW